MLQQSLSPHPQFYKTRFAELKHCAHSGAYCHSVVALTKLVHWKMLIPERRAMFVSSSTASRTLKLIWCSASWHLSLFLYLEWRSQTSRGWTLRHSRDKKQSTKCWYHVASRMLPFRLLSLGRALHTWSESDYSRNMTPCETYVSKTVSAHCLRNLWPFTHSTVKGPRALKNYVAEFNVGWNWKNSLPRHVQP
jgi:hypothetical protein